MKTTQKTTLLFKQSDESMGGVYKIMVKAWPSSLSAGVLIPPGGDMPNFISPTALCQELSILWKKNMNPTELKALLGITEEALELPKVAAILLEEDIEADLTEGERWRAYKEKCLDRFYKDLKSPSPHQKDILEITKLCHSLVSCKVSLISGIALPPFYPRGTKGYLLEDQAISLFPENIQKEIQRNMEQNGTKLVLFPEVVMGIPSDNLKVVYVKNRKRERDQKEQFNL